MDNSYIKRFINFHCSDKVKKRGADIHKNNGIIEAIVDVKSGEASFTVQGSSRYKVKISGFTGQNIKTSCSCPFTWGEICKHTVAALLYLKNEDYLHKQPSHIKEKPAPKPKQRRANEPYPVSAYKNLTHEFVMENLAPAQKSYLAYMDFVILTASLSDTKLVFQVLEKYGYYASKVELEFEGGMVYSKSDNSKITGKLSFEEAFVLKSIAGSGMPDFLDFWFGNRKQLYKQQFVKDYGLSEKEVFDDYFTLEFSIGKGIYVTARQKALGIIPLCNDFYHPYMDLIKKFGEDAGHEVNLSVKQHRSAGFVLRLVDAGREKRFYEIYAIKGKAGKDGSRLVSHIGPADSVPVSESLCLTENQENLMDCINLLKNNEVHNGVSLAIWKKVFKYLDKEQFVFFSYLPALQVRKMDLHEINISPHEIDLEFVVRETKQFTELHPRLIAGDNKYSIDDLDRDKSVFTHSFINKTLYVNASIKVCDFLANYVDTIKLPKGHMDVFFGRVIKPLSGIWNFDFGASGDFSVEKIRLLPLKKQVYLSESNDFIVIRPQVVYDHDITCVLNDSSNILEMKDNTLFEFQRDIDFEKNFAGYLVSLHPEFQTQNNDNVLYLSFGQLMEDNWFFDFFDKLQKEDVGIFGLKDLKKFRYSPYQANVNTGIKSGQDWFEVNIEVSFGDNIVSLKDLKRAIIKKQKYIQLSDGTVGILPEKWLAKLEQYFRNGEIKKDKLNISKLRYSIIDDLFEDIDNEKILEEIARKRQELKEIGRIESVAVPKAIRAKLRDYQKEGLNWLHFLDKLKWGGILADDMGLGKTLQVLTFIQKMKNAGAGPSLVVAPTTLLFNWENELRKFAPQLTALFYYGLQREKDTSYFSGYDLVFTTYGLIVRDIELLQSFEFHYIILDESQAIKNPGSQRFKAVNLLKAFNKLALTGTPVENSTFDLYAQMTFLNPGFFGTLKSFRENYSNAIDKEGSVAVAAELQKMINPFILRRTKEQVARELPPKTEDIIYCEMDGEQRRIYDAYRNEYRDMLLKKISQDGLAKSKMFVLEGLLKLRQICNSPALLNDDDIDSGESVKIKELIRYISGKTARHKILVFSQFVSMLGLIREKLEANKIDYAYLDGQSTAQQRKISVNNFQGNENLRVFLISLKAGGLGLNLTAADYVFLVDPWWNPAVEEQAIDRCYRIGQDKKVFAYRMICKNTIEEKIQSLQQKKRKIASDIIRVDEESIVSGLKLKDIKELFG
ncbi:MAG: SNF2 helicase associated domain-containing protein [Bacteroidales bacterium]|nr:SNF2 helicase associated domain-containing protein [Bacteroidales bacterium]